MNLSHFLNSALKSDELIELFEAHDVEVVYSYDRLHQGMEDQYFGSMSKLGLQFVFNCQQVLKAIFVYAHKNGEFQAANLPELGITSFSEKASVVAYAQENSINYTEGAANFLGKSLEWAKFEFSNHSVHYEYKDGALALVTLQPQNA
ncbi:hypothetical protein [Microbulbifer aggregans]|uniref:hypothetical protein n=1 Tax=Microbulbifer aggregans TaxID=1769779 RepID=UPI001CFF4799|nr:hypothetical protein [Microbulbifer aggregans]